MAKTHFEQAIEDEKRKTADTAMRLAHGDSHGLANLQGIYKGLEKALQLQKDAAKKDLVE